MFSYNFVKDVAGKTPRYRMGDGAKEITKAGLEVFGAYGDRLMSDIEFLQWSAHNEVTFHHTFWRKSF